MWPFSSYLFIIETTVFININDNNKIENYVMPMLANLKLLLIILLQNVTK